MSTTTEETVDLPPHKFVETVLGGPAPATYPMRCALCGKHFSDPAHEDPTRVLRSAYSKLSLVRHRTARAMRSDLLGIDDTEFDRFLVALDKAITLAERGHLS